MQGQLTLFNEKKKVQSDELTTNPEFKVINHETRFIYKCTRCGTRFAEPRQTANYTAICPQCGHGPFNVEAI